MIYVAVDKDVIIRKVRLLPSGRWKVLDTKDSTKFSVGMIVPDIFQGYSSYVREWESLLERVLYEGEVKGKK